MVVMRVSESEPRVAYCSGLSACHAFRFLLPAIYACPVHKLHSRNRPYLMTFGYAYYLFLTVERPVLTSASSACASLGTNNQAHT
jgi:hypothetical protein